MKRTRNLTIFSLLVLLFSIFLPMTGLLHANRSAQAAGTVYSNIAPNYQTDSSGTRPAPANSWSIPGQTDVVNHQGGTASAWDGVTSWNGDPANKTNSYIKYGSNTNNPDFAIRKYAKQTAVPGLYDVYLNVKGNEQQQVDPLDIVLVVDMSGSMESAKAAAARQGVKDFLATLLNSGYADKINVGLVGYSSPGNNYASAHVNPAPVTSAQAAAINTALSPTFVGGTFTQSGIRDGSTMLASLPANHKKMMILMTDGVPTFSYKVTNASIIGGLAYGTSFSTTLDQPGNTSRLNSSYSASGITIADTWAATLGEARIQKAAGAEIHALGIQLANDGTYLTQAEVEQRMKLLASTDSTGLPYYQAANTPAAIQQYLYEQSQLALSYFSTISNGSINDPLGSQFLYANPTGLSVTSVGSNVITSLPTAVISGSNLQATNLNIGLNQEVQIHYQIRINTEDAAFQPDHWYQTNGRTLLTPNSANPTNQVDFAIPSAKAPGVSIQVNKLWNLLTSASPLPSAVAFTVNRASTTSPTAWQQAKGSLAQSDNWTKSFTQLQSGANTVYLPKFNNLGANFVYTVVSEDAVTGFVSNIANNNGVFTITNSELGVNAEKYSRNNQAPLAGSQFVITKYIGNWTTVDPSFSPITINGNQSANTKITPGYYQIRESKAPDGYALETTAFNFRVDDQGKFFNASNQEITSAALLGVDNFYLKKTALGAPVIVLAKYDALKAFDLVVNKIDQTTGKSLTGAQFTLKDANGNVINAQESGATATFTFNGLPVGKYTLTETQAPNGYMPFNKTIEVTIAADGTVTVTNSDGWTSSLEANGNNKIALTVKNTVKNVFPATGGPGTEKYAVISLSFILTALAASGLYLFRIKRRHKS
ncbi:MAG: SpaA isopeptide-forming pilin-related protein [Oenococcus sp.]|uniref:SpaA isopeptide-forming pilin-related protein n=1 Tax=Oenococcus TaxID=46254 RepID=UPI0021E81077|nr:SpaA isopeptide-forming pilin-related protein [Oenococcus kitaharae]MCV3296595.1 SpaA isopeptide-forming pilin-related protein [Oenococcus kitaharae]